MTTNIQDIVLWEDNPDKTRVSKVVKINFKFPCTWTILDLNELEQILKLWLKGEYLRWGSDEKRHLFKKFVNNILDIETILLEQDIEKEVEKC